jgi:hypothetical protein
VTGAGAAKTRAAVPRSTVHIPGARAEESTAVVKTYIMSPSP